MMLKFFLGIAIVALTSLIGHLLARKYRQRKDFYVQFSEFNERFLSELAYRRRPIRDFFASYPYQGEFSALLQAFFDTIDKHTPFDAPEYTFLNKEESGFIRDYFSMLGRGDSLSQRGYFSSVKSNLNRFSLF